MKTPLTLLLALVLGVAVFTGCQERDAISKEFDNARNNVMDTAQGVGDTYNEAQKGLKSANDAMNSAKKLQTTAESVNSQLPR